MKEKPAITRDITDQLPDIERSARRLKNAARYAGSMETHDLAVDAAVAAAEEIARDATLVPGTPRFFAFINTCIRNDIAARQRAPRNRDRASAPELPEAEDGSDLHRDLQLKREAERVRLELEKFFRGEGLGRRYSEDKRKAMREALHLHVEEDLSADAIEVRIGTPRTTVNNWLRFLREKVLADLAEARRP